MKLKADHKVVLQAIKSFGEPVKYLFLLHELNYGDRELRQIISDLKAMGEIKEGDVVE